MTQPKQHNHEEKSTIPISQNAVLQKNQLDFDDVVSKQVESCLALQPKKLILTDPCLIEKSQYVVPCNITADFPELDGQIQQLINADMSEHDKATLYQRTLQDYLKRFASCGQKQIDLGGPKQLPSKSEPRAPLAVIRPPIQPQHTAKVGTMFQPSSIRLKKKKKHQRVVPVLRKQPCWESWPTK